MGGGKRERTKGESSGRHLKENLLDVYCWAILLTCFMRRQLGGNCLIGPRLCLPGLALSQNQSITSLLNFNKTSSRSQKGVSSLWVVHLGPASNMGSRRTHRCFKISSQLGRGA
jgi:hypothetical protein